MKVWFQILDEETMWYECFKMKIELMIIMIVSLYTKSSFWLTDLIDVVILDGVTLRW